MTELELLSRVRELRERGRSPKEIARGLGVPRSEVDSLVRALAMARPKEAPPVAGCWISARWSEGLGVAGHPDWPDTAASGSDQAGRVCVVAAWEQRYGRVSCCVYLVDPWCLGVKDVIGPRHMDSNKLAAFREECFGAFDHPPLRVPIELAQHLVWGSVDYARSLGFEPHPDFDTAAAPLARPSGPCALSFGRDGRPCYTDGPFDDVQRVVRTLAGSVGEGNFDFTVSVA